MKFGEFKNEIEQAFVERFPKSCCSCRISKCLGKSISIDCYLSQNEKECPWNQPANDVMQVLLHIDLPSGWSDEDELPESLSMKALRNSITVKPTDPCFFCSNKTVDFRKTKGNPRKMIDTFGKFVDRLYAMIKEEYLKRNLMDSCVDLIKAKEYFSG